MIAFAYIDKDGLPTGGGIRPALPEGAIPLTRPFTIADLPRVKLVDGAWTLRDDLAHEAPTTVEEVEEQAAYLLARARREATARINARAGTIRLQVYTEIPGQDAMYLEKRAEALAYLEEVPEPKTLDNYPLIAGEVGLTARTPYELAQIWLNRAYLFKLVGGATESARLRATYAIATARDEGAIAAIEAEVITAFASLPI